MNVIFISFIYVAMSRKERIKNRLFDELPKPLVDEVEVSSSGRKRKPVDYRILGKTILLIKTVFVMSAMN